uniref:Uncharacterized protein n=1 Tax=Avena sativa TaxID=4498 RepID=A0ACD5ZYS1_AVESA
MEMDAGGPHPKKRRSASPGVGEDGGGADCISALPDAVLGDIISLLSTKEGARTRILASRWRDLWRSAPLNLDYRDLAIEGVTVRTDVVSRILSSHRGPGRRLYVNTYSLNVPADSVEACLRSAALNNLEDLDFTDHRIEQPHLTLIFRFSPTLRVANICKCDLSDITFQGLHFPLLRQLGLIEFKISELSLHSLIHGCPVLECFLIDRCVGFRSVRINSLTIRSISAGVSLYRFHPRPTHRLLLEQLVIENAPCLVRLLIPGQGISLQVVVVAAPKLETLGFITDACDPTDPYRLVFGSTVIKGLCVEKLVTVVRTVKMLALDMQNLSLDMVIDLMRCFPCLEKLYIQVIMLVQQMFDLLLF